MRFRRRPVFEPDLERDAAFLRALADAMYERWLAGECPRSSYIDARDEADRAWRAA